MLGGRAGRQPGAAGPGRLRRPGHPDLRRAVASPTTCGSAPTSTRAGTPRLARDRIERLGLDPAQRAGKLSGGQRAQLALTLAIAKRPELLILDEPVASLDPLARREFLQSLMEVIAEHELSVVLSSHLVADLERVCDYLIVLVASRVQVAGEVDDLLATHHLLTGPRRDPAACPPAGRSSRPATPTGRAPCWSAPTARSTTRPGPSSRSAWKTWSSPT